MSEDGLTRTIRRQRVFLVLAGVAVAVSVGGLVGSLFIKSPAEQAVEASPPPPSVLSAPVALKTLETVVTTRGTVEVGSTVDVVAEPSTVGQSLIVTAIKKRAGQTAKFGDVLAVVSGRPVFLLQGKIPAYRTLTPGSTGDDVSQLQRAMKGIGFGRANWRSGTFDASTQDAVRKFYAAKGFTPLTADDLDPGVDAAVAAAEDTVTQAQRALETAQATTKGLSGTELALAKRQASYAKADLRQASEKLAAARSRTGAVWPMSEAAFVSSSRVSVGAVVAAVGTNLAMADSARIMTLNLGAPVVRTTVPQGSQVGLKKGLSVAITDDVNGRDAAGTVSAVGDFRAAGSDGSAGDVSGYPVAVAPDEPLPASWLGCDVRLEISVGRTPGEVLAVPVTALTTSADNRTWVTVLADDGRQTPVQVTTGLYASGEVEARPERSDQLTPGMRVVIG